MKDSDAKGETLYNKPESAEDMSFYVFEDYQIVKKIGQGTFGKVYLVRKKDSGLPFAMKILKKDQLIKKNLLIKTQGKLFFTLTRVSILIFSICLF